MSEYGDHLGRCGWCADDALYVAYHDQEWGVPETGQQALFERLTLEGMQAGLSWITVLRKREQMRRQFFGFDISRLAEATELDVQRWLNDSGLIRHRGKLEAMVSNARLVVEMDNLGEFIWAFAPTTRPPAFESGLVPSVTAESTAMSKAMKKRGFKFVGPTICYAFMQSIGMVNDHIAGCFRYAQCEQLALLNTATAGS